MTAEIGDRVDYRSFAGDVYDAVVTAVRSNIAASDGFRQFVDIDVTIPGVREPWPLRAIRWYEDRNDPNPGARPKESRSDKKAERQAK